MSKDSGCKKDPIRMFCVVRHSKQDAALDNLGRPIKEYKRRCSRPKVGAEYAVYKPGVNYSLFAPFEGPAKTVVSLKRPMKGFLVEKYFGKEKGIEKYRESLFSYGNIFKFSKVFSPFDR